MELIIDVLLPETDTGVFIQASLVLVVVTVTLWKVRFDPERRLLVVGTALVVFALIGLRALH